MLLNALRIASVSLSVLAGVAAQTIRLPTPSFATGSDTLPLASSPTRYQQWYAASELQAAARLPVRIRGLAFLAGNVLQPGSTVDIEIRMAHLPLGQLPSITFDNNLRVDNTLVVPRAVLTLVSQPLPGTRVITFSFAREFWWNGTSGVVIDVKVFGNGNNNQGYIYPCLIATGALGKTQRLFAPGNPGGLQQATVSQNGVGLLTEFDYADGLTVSFGSGCPGGAAVPIAGTSGGLPIPPNPAWTQTLGGAAPLTPVVLVLGASNTTFPGGSLPFDLGVIGFNGCFLRVDPAIFIPAASTAAGTASVPMPIPGVTLRRVFMFAQWFVLDTAAPNGALAASQGLWHVFG